MSVRVPRGEPDGGRMTLRLPTRRGLGNAAVKVSERYAIVALWGVMIAVYSALEPSTFDTGGTFQTIFGSQAALVFLSMAFLATVIVGEFVDLSVASVLGLCATIVPVLSVLDHVNVALASVIAVAVGTLFLAEPVTLRIVVGAALVLVGVAVALRKR